MVLRFCSFPLVCTLSPGDSLHGLPYLWDLHPIPSPGMLLHILMGLKYLWKGRFPFLVDLSTCLSPTAYISPQYFLSSSLSSLPWDISLISGLSMDSSSSMALELLPFRSRPCSSFDSYTTSPPPSRWGFLIGLPCMCPASLPELHSPLSLLFTTAHMFPLAYAPPLNTAHLSPQHPLPNPQPFFRWLHEAFP